jgi:plastocyanin
MNLESSRIRTLAVACGIIATLLTMPAFGAIHQIDVGNFFFSPQKTVVQPGDTVRWVPVSGTHTTTSLVSSPKQWDSGILSGSYDVVFNVSDGPGPFPYRCEVHPVTMIDTIFVKCCQNPGNVDGIIGVAGPVDVADLTYLVGYLFQGGAAPPCIDDGNVDGIIGVSGPIDVADLTYLVAFLFQGGSPSPLCS